jgi:hypothetical protein
MPFARASYFAEANGGGSGANFKKGRRADPGALGERESLACQIGPKFKLCTRSLATTLMDVAAEYFLETTEAVFHKGAARLDSVEDCLHALAASSVAGKAVEPGKMNSERASGSVTTNPTIGSKLLRRTFASKLRDRPSKLRRAE